MFKIKNPVPTVLISGTLFLLMLIVLAAMVKDPAVTEYKNVISWIKSDHPELVGEEEILEFYPDLKKIRARIKRREILKTRYYNCLKELSGIYFYDKDKALRKYAREMRALQAEIDEGMKIFLAEHNIINYRK